MKCKIPRGWLYTAIRLLSLVALVFASALAVDYYFNANTFCGEGQSCDIVAKSDFGQKYGIFLPTLGLAAYSFFFLTSFFFARTKRRLFNMSLSTFWIPLAIICCAAGAFAFVLIQAFHVEAFCYLCMGIDISAMLMVIPAVLLMVNKLDEAEDESIPAPTHLHPMFWIGLYVLAAGSPLTWGSFQPPAVHKSTAPEFIQAYYVDGKVNIVEISSFRCPHCRMLHPELNKVIEKYGDIINFNRLTIPLGNDANALKACVAYYCAENQKKESEFADCMFRQPNRDDGQLLTYARECSIDENSFKQCLASPESAKSVDDLLKKIEQTGFKGAPTVWINDMQIIGYDHNAGMQPYVDAIESILKKDAQQKKLALNARFPLAFIICLVISGLCLLSGTILTVTRKKEDKKDDKKENKD